MQIVSEIDAESGVLMAKNAFQQEYPDQRAFLVFNRTTTVVHR